MKLPVAILKDGFNKIVAVWCGDKAASKCIIFKTCVRILVLNFRLWRLKRHSRRIRHGRISNVAHAGLSLSIALDAIWSFKKKKI